MDQSTLAWALAQWHGCICPYADSLYALSPVKGQVTSNLPSHHQGPILPRRPPPHHGVRVASRPSAAVDCVILT